MSFSTKTSCLNLSSIFSLCFFTTFSVTIGKVNSMTKEEMNSGSNYVWMFMAQLVWPGTLIFIFAAVHYVRHVPLRETVLKEVKSLARSCWERQQFWSVWRHCDAVIISVMSLWHCHHQRVTTLPSSHQWNSVIVMSSVLHPQCDDIIVMSSMRCHYCDVFNVMLSLWSHQCYVLIVMPSGWCHQCDAVIVMSLL